MSQHRRSTGRKKRSGKRNLKIILNKLKKEIPENTSCHGCGECCGPILLLPQEITKIARVLTTKNLWPEVAKNMLRARNDKTEDGKDRDTCPLLMIDTGDLGNRKTHCMVYSQRPIVCRLYNNVQGLKCPLGRWPWSTTYRPSKYLDMYYKHMQEHKVYMKDELMQIIKDADAETQQSSGNIYTCGHCGFTGHCYGTASAEGVSAPWCPKCGMNNKLIEREE